MNNKVFTFFNSITPEILSPSDYVNWSKINKKVRSLRREIALLQSLDIESPILDLADLLHNHPKILNVLKLLIAHTPDKIFFNDKEKFIDFKKDILNVKNNFDRSKEIALIFIEMGLIDFLKEVKNIEDVIKGVLIGLEPNVRKNRRGKKLEAEINFLISETIDIINKENDTHISYKSQVSIDLINERKKLDYVILNKEKPLIAIEVNFYSTSGSKPSEVLGRAYPEVQNNLKKKGIGFIVITDGIGWEKMKPVITTAYEKLDYLMNIQQAKKGALKQAILELLQQNK